MAQRTRATELRVGPQGRMVIPVELRRVWKLESGEVLLAHLDGDQLILERPAQVIERIRQRYAHLRGDPGLVDELIAERRRNAQQEDAEATP